MKRGHLGLLLMAVGVIFMFGPVVGFTLSVGDPVCASFSWGVPAGEDEGWVKWRYEDDWPNWNTAGPGQPYTAADGTNLVVYEWTVCGTEGATTTITIKDPGHEFGVNRTIFFRVVENPTAEPGADSTADGTGNHDLGGGIVDEEVDDDAVGDWGDNGAADGGFPVLGYGWQGVMGLGMVIVGFFLRR